MAQTLPSWCAFFLYAASCAAAFAYLYNKKEGARRLMLSLLGTGLLLHLAAFGARLAAFWAFPENRWFMPVNSFFGALSYLSLALAFAFFFIEARKKLGILGAFILPFVALGLGAALLKADPSLSPLDPRLRSYWLNVHPMVLMTAYAAFANAFGVCLALLLQERQLKSRKPGALLYRLPSIDELDSLNGRIVAVALPVFAAGLAMGAMWAHQAWGRAWSWDPKETMALITAGFYAEFLWLRYASGQRGRRAVYVSMAGFACLIATFLGAELGAGRHDFLGAK